MPRLKALQAWCKVVGIPGLRGIAPPHMRTLCVEIVETICLAVWEGMDVDFTGKIECRKLILSWSTIVGMPLLRRVETGEAFLAAECDRMGGQVRNRLAVSPG